MSRFSCHIFIMENKCINCEYYLQYYVKSKFGLQAVHNCGHCVKINTKKLPADCHYFCEINKEAEKEKKTININKSIIEILSILQKLNDYL